MINKKVQNIQNKAFTLVEILVAITMFSIIMVFMVYIYTGVIGLTTKVDLTRAMQENVKNIVEHISDDIYKNGISGVSAQVGISDCDLNLNSDGYKLGNKLCLGTGSLATEYYIQIKNEFGYYSRVSFSDMDNICSKIKNTCILFKKKDGDSPVRLSNSMVSFKSFKVYVSNEINPKVTLSFILAPASRKGVNADLIKNSTLNFQTTLSEKIIKSN